MCSGYYRYAEGYTPAFAGMERFKGRIVHPQKWTDDIDYAGKRVVVIGSGATAVTLVPEMAKTAAHVTMLQRSPTYVVARPSEDGIANGLRRVLPAKLAYGLPALKQVLLLCISSTCAGAPGRKTFKSGGVRLFLARLRHRHPFHAALQSVEQPCCPTRPFRHQNRSRPVCPDRSVSPRR